MTFFWSEDVMGREVRVADPILEFTVINSGNTAAIVSRIGIFPTAAWTSPKGPPFAGKVTAFDYYELEISSFEPLKPVLLRLPDPIHLSPNASYRFRLRLKRFAAGVKRNEAALRLLVIANNVDYASEEFYLGLHQFEPGDDMPSDPPEFT